METPFWCVPRTTQNMRRLANGPVTAEQVVDARRLLLPPGVVAEEIILIDQSVPRTELPVGTGGRIQQMPPNFFFCVDVCNVVVTP